MTRNVTGMGQKRRPSGAPSITLVAAYDVHHAKVFGRCEDTTGIVAFTNLVTQVMTREPYTSVDRVFWIVDNGLRAPSRRGDRRSVGTPSRIAIG